MKTLAVRMKRHEENGVAIASYLSHHPKVKKLYYPVCRTIRSTRSENR